MDQDYYKAYYHLERKHWWFLVRKKIIAERISTLLHPPTNTKSLNVGAATGATSDMLAEFGSVMSIEYDVACTEFAKIYMTTPIEQGSILELPFDANQYDLVAALDVVEHVEDHQLAVQELWRVCNPGGHIVITVPAYAFLWSEHDVINHHFRRYTINELTALFQDLPGKMIYKTYYNTFLFVPIAAYRLLMNGWKKWLGKSLQSAVKYDYEVLETGGWLNNILYGIFHLDYYLLKAGIRFPAGVSIMIFFQKENKPAS
ncbi:MAG: methyltransferase domain-containing protein [Sediminibacterium sp.]